MIGALPRHGGDCPGEARDPYKPHGGTAPRNVTSGFDEFVRSHDGDDGKSQRQGALILSIRPGVRAVTKDEGNATWTYGRLKARCGCRRPGRGVPPTTARASSSVRRASLRRGFEDHNAAGLQFVAVEIRQGDGPEP